MADKRYVIKAIHPESDSEWTEPGSYDDPIEATTEMHKLPPIDNGHGHHFVFDTLENKPVYELHKL